MKKNICSIALCLAMLLSCIAAFGADSQYTDVSQQEVALVEALTLLKEYNIMDGYPDGTFRPEDIITRAEMVKSVLAAQNIHFQETGQTEIQPPFTDVDAAHWACPYIERAKEMGIIEGNGDGTFSPENPVTFAEAAKMIMTMIGYRPYAESVGGFPTGYIVAAQRYGLLEDADALTFQESINRKNTGIILYHAVNTPLMVHSSVGDGTYIIMDGTNGYERITLLSRDFKGSEKN